MGLGISLPVPPDQIQASHEFDLSMSFANGLGTVAIVASV
jgi:hypothetical protein